MCKNVNLYIFFPEWAKMHLEWGKKSKRKEKNMLAYEEKIHIIHSLRFCSYNIFFILSINITKLQKFLCCCYVCADSWLDIKYSNHAILSILQQSCFNCLWLPSGNKTATKDTPVEPPGCVFYHNLIVFYFFVMLHVLWQIGEGVFIHLFNSIVFFKILFIYAALTDKKRFHWPVLFKIFGIKITVWCRTIDDCLKWIHVILKW